MKREVKYSFKQWCEDNERQDWLDLWDYELNGIGPDEVAYKTGKRCWFKCAKGLHKSEHKNLVHITNGKTTLFCKRCRSFGQYLIDKFGPNGIDTYWSDQNQMDPFSIFRGSQTKVWLKCSEPGSNHPDYMSQPAMFSTQGCRCPICSNRQVVSGLNDVATTRPDVVAYFFHSEDAARYSAMSGHKVEMVCPECGTVQEKQIAHVSAHGFHCCACSDGVSYPNKFLYEMLSQLKTKREFSFEREKVFRWSRNKYQVGRRLYDFYIDWPQQVIIEAHGRQHYDGGFCTIPSARSLQEEQDNDAYKRFLALQNGIDADNYIVLDCRYSSADWIQQSVMSSHLPSLFDFTTDDINWKQCDIIASSNLIKVACDLWNAGMHDLKQIASRMGLHYGTVTAYLQKGENFGWTEYGHTKNRPLLCLDDGLVFPSAKICAENSMTIWGVQLTALCVNSVARGSRKSTGGLHFRYLSRDQFQKIKSSEPHRVYDEYLKQIA